MNYRKKLFSHRNIYDTDGTQALFMAAVQQNLNFHLAHCAQYAALMAHQGFVPDGVKTVEDLCHIPPLPTVFLKKHRLLSVPEHKLLVKGTTSGTSGKPSLVGLDKESGFLALRMVLATFRRHRLISPRLTNYIVLGYQPSKHNQMGAVKTAFGATLFAPALHREYALKSTGTDYELNMEGIRQALLRYQKQKLPVRFMGFPAYLHMLLTELQRQNLRLTLHPSSKIFMAGGWKQFFYMQADKKELYHLAGEYLGIGQENIRDFFGAVEHPVLYCDCPRHHFHVPVYSRVIIRHPATLKPVPYGTPGLLNLVSPLVGSMPLLSVITDDLAVMQEGKKCGCGISSPYFEILGRVGLQDIKTCAAGAAEKLEGVEP